MQLDTFEIDELALDAPGRELGATLREFEPLQPDRLVDGRLLPRTGWRVVARQDAAVGGPARVALAAPSPDEEGAWALVVLVHEPAGWRRVVSNPGPLHPIAGLAARRERLKLRWPSAALVFRSGSVPDLHVLLCNISDGPLGGPNDKTYSQDGGQVVAFVLNEAGEPLPHALGINRGMPLAIPRLAPDEQVELPALLITRNVSVLPPGNYGVKAVLPTMELWSNVARLTLT